VILAKTLQNNAYYHMLKGTPQLRKHPVYHDVSYIRFEPKRCKKK
jgi:hypothetical protein